MNSEISEDAAEIKVTDVQISDNSDADLNQPNISTHQSSDKITLTSRRVKKHVSIHDDVSNQPREIAIVEDALDLLENNFESGIQEIRGSLKQLRSEKKSYEIHIKSLEESLRKCSDEKEKCHSVINEMKKDMEFLAAKLEATKKANELLHGEKQNILSDHEDHLHSIADQYRRKHLAKKTLKKWKEKLKQNYSRNPQVTELLEENQKLKRELLLYQECTKHAFLRSANALNSEALSLFQDTALRCLNLEGSSSDPRESFRSSRKSQLSDYSSSTTDSDLDLGRDQGNKKDARQRKISTKSHSDDNEKGHGRSHSLRFHSDNELERFHKSAPKPRPRSKDFLPESLRNETKHIMSQLGTKRKQNANLLSRPLPGNNETCQAKSHVHVCHCTPLPGRPGDCPFCFAPQNYNFVNMPTSNKVKPNSRSAAETKAKNDSYKSLSGQNPSVIYKPSGSTVIIEKHLDK